ncbi:MAG: hypothetical protein AB7V56_06400 [Candidatus Nitrosocosmicus sp.]
MNYAYKGEYNFAIDKKVKINKLSNSNDVVITLDDENYVKDILLITYGNSEEEVEKNSEMISFNLEKILIVLWGRKLRLLEKGYNITELSTGKGRGGTAFHMGWSIEGSIKELDLNNKNTNTLINSGSNENLIHLSSSVSYYYIGNPFVSIKEAYKIIENIHDPNHDKFKVLRHIFSHSPPYNQSTIDMFTKAYSSVDFDYLKYDLQNRIIILNPNSNKTLKRLNGVAVELQKICKTILNIS